MGEEGAMAGANCKRYLQNKLVDRKRRRPNSALLEGTEIVDDQQSAGDSPGRLRQTTRQSSQRHLISSINSLAKTNKTDVVSRITTTGSKKCLRSTRQENETLSDNDNLKKNCQSPEYDTMSFTDSDKNVFNTTRDNMYLENGNSYAINKNDNEQNFEKKQFDKEYDVEETLNNEKDRNIETINNDVSTDSQDKCETMNVRECQSTFNCNSSNVRLQNLSDENEDTNVPSSSYQETMEECSYKKFDNVVFENKPNANDNCAENENDKTYKNPAENDDIRSEQTAFTPLIAHDLQDNNLVHEEQTISPNRTHLSCDGAEQPVLYENELSNLSNSLCSENSSSIDHSCKINIENINENFPSNETKQQPLDECILTETEQNRNNVFKSTNETMKPSLLNSTKAAQSTINFGMPKSPKNESYEGVYKDEVENHGCAIKTSSAILPSVLISSQPKDDTFNEIAINSKFENVAFQETELKNDCTNVLSSIEAASDVNYASKEETDSKNLLHNDCKKNEDPTSIVQAKQSFLKEYQEENTEKLHDTLESRQNRNDAAPEHSHFEKFLEKGSPSQRADFENQHNETITHQQHEKDIIDAADKVYTQIEEHYRQQHETTISATYGQIINNHQEHQNIPHKHEEHHQRQDVVESLQQMQTMQQHALQQQHYPAEQLYQLQQQQDHHQHIQMQRHQMQKHEELQQQQQQHHQQQQQHNIQPIQPRDQHRQQHPHLMDFLHPQHHHSNVPNTHSPSHQHQQQHHIHEVYHDLMMDEFHEEHNTPYKLGLSPSTVKHENQDDGYETSAGDVLTPNSHASSTHSVTPQHHMQHAAVVSNVIKCEEHQHGLRLQHNTRVLNEQNPNMQPEMIANDSAANMTNRDPYHFIDDDINSAPNNSLRNILTPPHSHTRSNPEGFMVMQSEAPTPTNLNPTNDMYGLTNSAVHHLHPQKPQCLDTNSNAPITNPEPQHYTDPSTEIVGQEQDSILNLQTKSIQKRRGRKKKIPDDGLQTTLDKSNPNDPNSMTGFAKTKERKKHDRFNGMSEEEVVKRILPDHLCDNLDIVIIGINPGLFAAYKGHHYAGPGNHFWKCLYLSGLTQEQMNADEDFKLIKYGIGFTNMVQRATKGSADLTRKEIKEGSRILLEKLQRFRPKIAVFNGKLIFEVFSGKKDFNFGRQPECVEGTDTFIWVMPSSSARCAQLPRAADKVPFYAALKKFRDYLNGLIPHIDQSECVFTEERIKQQCEQENYKNQQNNATGVNDSAYQNAVGILNVNNSMQNPVGYSFDSESNPHGASEGPGPPQSAGGDNNASNSFMMSSLVGTQHEKKKRGRPKKIKGQEIIDPVTGNKIQVNSQLMGASNGEYPNILNLSVVQVSNSEMPKKKRGRPKKVKPPPNMLQQDISQPTAMLSQKPSIMSIQSLTSEITQGSPHHMQGLQGNHQHVALYSTPPPHQRSIYSPMASPMTSPSLNCSYTTNTPPSHPHHDKLGLPNNGGGRESSKPTSADLVQPAPHQQHPIQDQNYGESPPPSSPNICNVDFEPPTASTAASSIVSESVNSDLNSMHQRIHNTHQRSRFNSPISGEATPDHNANEHFQQWLSPQPNQNIHSPAAATTMYANSPQQPSLNYHEQQQQQMQTIQQQQPQHQELHPQWPLRHQSRYDELANSPYLLGSQLHQTHTHAQSNQNHQGQNGSSDVARKSLSGLESLVDQIPTISESESIALSSAAAVNAQVAAAAAVESRLQGMQSSTLGDAQGGDEPHFSSITGNQNLLTTSNSPTSAPTNTNQLQQSSSSSNLLNSNFSVSNLAASSASSNNNNNNNNHDNYGLASNARPLANPNAYHHSNLMAAAVLAAAAANTNPSAAATNNHHASMYMDPHAHLTTHVPVNSIYSSAVPPSHHHHHSAVTAHHHHAAAHYASAQHSAADYAASNNPYSATQTNVNASHTLHMPSPNYPYGYPTAPTQTNYSAYPHSHHTNHHHGHPHAHHTAHHLAMFDRLKPSDLTGYGSGF